MPQPTQLKRTTALLALLVAASVCVQRDTLTTKRRSEQRDGTSETALATAPSIAATRRSGSRHYRSGGHLAAARRADQRPQGRASRDRGLA